MMTFPEDHGIHPECRYEWWHHVGNLMAEDGHRFGYQVTFFRKKVAFRQAFIIHLAVSDITGRQYFNAEKKTRHGVVCGPEDFSICAKGCFISSIGGTSHRVVAQDDQISIDLSLMSKTRSVVHEKPGYYSLPNLSTVGEIRIKDKVYPVQGTSWMDHEFFSKPCAREVSGWDWFGLHLSNLEQLMIYKLRGENGCLPASGATIIRNGIAKHLYPETVAVKELVQIGAYPSMWDICIPSEGIDLLVSPGELSNQEFRSRVLDLNYWEGAVSFGGSHSGAGYVEMTGYDKPFRALSKWQALKTYVRSKFNGKEI
jgi:predicted secreted hydrolase